MKASERPMAKVIDICSKIPGVLDRYTERQQTVFTQIKNCRTEFMGVNVYTCSNSECGHRESRYVSCKNRNCSICSWLPREKWKLQRSNDMIPSTSYYHYVFTIPYELSQICSANKSEVQGLLFRSVAETLKSFEKTHCKNGKIGFIQCLHTWSTRLLEHSHIHVIMPGGYLKDDVWYDMPDYMFPQKALAVKFRGVFCSGLRRLYKKKPFHLPGHLCTLSDPKVWGEFMDSNYKRHWHVHVEPTRGGDPMKLVGYLSNYVYKTAIDHSRIQHVDSEKVVFKCRPRDKSSNEKSQRDSDSDSKENAGGFFSGLFNKVQEGVSTATANVENVLNNFIEALAILLVTSCLIPILVLIFFVWLVKMLLGLNIDIPTSVRK